MRTVHEFLMAAGADESEVQSGRGGWMNQFEAVAHATVFLLRDRAGVREGPLG
jgi:hypothetical protein